MLNPALRGLYQSSFRGCNSPVLASTPTRATATPKTPHAGGPLRTPNPFAWDASDDEDTSSDYQDDAEPFTPHFLSLSPCKPSTLASNNSSSVCPDQPMVIDADHVGKLLAATTLTKYNPTDEVPRPTGVPVAASGCSPVSPPPITSDIVPSDLPPLPWAVITPAPTMPPGESFLTGLSVRTPRPSVSGPKPPIALPAAITAWRPTPIAAPLMSF